MRGWGVAHLARAQSLLASSWQQHAKDEESKA